MMRFLTLGREEAHKDEDFRVTDITLLCELPHLLGRGDVIIIPYVQAKKDRRST